MRHLALLLALCFLTDTAAMAQDGGGFGGGGAGGGFGGGGAGGGFGGGGAGGGFGGGGAGGGGSGGGGSGGNGFGSGGGGPVSPGFGNSSPGSDGFGGIGEGEGGQNGPLIIPSVRSVLEQSLETKPLDIQRAVRTLQNREPYQLDTLSDYQADVPLLQGITFPKTGVPEIGADGRPVRNPSIIDLDNCPSCQPADPGIGLQTLSGLPGIELPPRLQDATTGGGASAQINQCGAAVQLLRAPVSPTRGNMIDDFDGACLKAGEPETYAQFDADDKREISECLAAHLLYEQNCLQYLDTITDTRIVGRVGMLFNVLDPGEPKPTCTATLISETLIVTARHCYYGEALGNLGPDADATGALAFAPSPVLLAAVKAHLPPYIEVAAEVTPVGERPVAVVTSYPQPPDDVIALRLKTPVPLESPRLKVSWAEVELGSELTLIGFQELAFRRALLEQRIKNAALTAGSSLLEDGAFSAFLRADHGAMCVVGDLTPGQFGHYCQSFQGTSGAPIFLGNLAGSPDPNSTIRLVGFQSRGNANDMPDKEIIGPPNTAARMSAELASLLGLQ